MDSFIGLSNKMSFDYKKNNLHFTYSVFVISPKFNKKSKLFDGLLQLKLF